MPLIPHHTHIHSSPVRNAGAGYAPTLATGNTSLVDAYFWFKTPGESDGCTEYLPSDSDAFMKGASCPRFDTDCGEDDSIGSDNATEPYAPEAGEPVPPRPPVPFLPNVPSNRPQPLLPPHFAFRRCVVLVSGSTVGG